MDTKLRNGKQSNLLQSSFLPMNPLSFSLVWPFQSVIYVNVITQLAWNLTDTVAKKSYVREKLRGFLRIFDKSFLYEYFEHI